MEHRWLSNGSIKISTVEVNNSTMPTTGEDEPDEKVDKSSENKTPKMYKYTKAAKTLLPYRSMPVNSKVFPSSEAGLLSYLTMSWLTRMMWKAFRVGLTKEDLWELDDIDKAETNAIRLNKLWEEEKQKVGLENASFRNVVWKFGRTRFYVSIFLMIFTVFFQFLGPAWILKSILTYVEDLTQPVEIGLGLAILAFVTQLIRNLSFSGMWMIGIHTGMRLQGAMQYMTYVKLLKLRNGGGNVLSQAVTFCTNDQERIFECVAGGVLVVAAPTMFIMCLAYTITVIGPWAILGNLVIFLFYPIMGGVAASIGITRRNTVPHTNQRVKVMTEILNYIKLIKMSGWEENFTKNVEGLRAEEEKKLRLAAFLQSLTATLTPMINIIAFIATFIGYSAGGNNLTATEVFTIFSVFATMQFTVGTLPFALRSIAEASVCFRNFKKYLELPEYEVSTNDAVECDHDSVVVIRNGSFAWDKNPAPKETSQRPKPTKRNKESDKSNGSQPEAEPLTEPVREVKKCLKNINIEIKRGKLVGISGKIGSGKSSLLSALLGDMMKVDGSVLIRGSLAYVSQEAWIYSGTFQENILFGLPLNKQKYDNVLEICCLKEDLAVLPDGDQTLLGDRGANLSGGQKQRLNLARSVYSDKSIYLLDDPLASVDPNVGNTIFIKCIKKHLSDKTVLLATHDIRYLKQCNETIKMQDGKVSLAVTQSERILTPLEDRTSTIFGTDDENFLSEEIMEVKHIEKPYLEIGGSCKAKQEHLNNKLEEQKFAILKETILKDDFVAYKKSAWSVLKLYMKACGGYCHTFSVFLFLLLFGVSRHSSSVWLQIWLDSGDGQMESRQLNSSFTNYTKDELKGYVTDNPYLGFYQGILLSTIFITLSIGLLKGYLTSSYVLRGATSLHSQMFSSVMKSPMSFFETTSIGRILSRFSKDMDELDARLPFFIEFVVQAILFVFLSLVIICVVYPFITIPMIFILGIMIFLDIWLNVGVRETKKLEIMLKSPVVHHIQSSMGGLSIIRTYNRQAIFERRFCEHLNRHLSAECVFRIANRWFTVRMDAVGLVTVFITIIISVLSREVVSAASIGLALSTVYMVCTFVPFVMRMKSELQARFTSVERILQYGEDLVPEKSENRLPLPAEWPMNGAIVFDSVTMSHRGDLPAVLRNVSIVIRGGEKIGIVGRTGAGKSSLFAALFRLCNLTEGNISIDGFDISTISLKHLRSQIAVIPQDPVLFNGTIRYNLDPFDKHNDVDVWAALEKARMKEKVLKKEQSLQSMVFENGENFSVGEKQLLCLARALLRNNKILLMDEATSSVDTETDLLIQEIIKQSFRDCTVLTIAHRCTAVDYYDRIIFMDNGQIIECDTVARLLKNEKSHYRQLMATNN